MITYSNIKRYENLDFEDYLKLKGLSHSYLKYELNGEKKPIEVTNNMILGSYVDSILTGESKSIDMLNPIYSAAKNIAVKIDKTFGSCISSLKSQISYTCEMEHLGYKITATGRLDYLLENNAVIDLKVTQSKKVYDLIKYMGYTNQLWHYSKMANVQLAYIMIHSVPLKETFMISLDVTSNSNDFFESKILKLGSL